MPIKSKTDGDYIPEDWKPNPETIERLATLYPWLNLEKTAVAFHDYWLSAAGPTAKKRNWNKAFCVWCHMQRPPAGWQTSTQVNRTVQL